MIKINVAFLVFPFCGLAWAAPDLNIASDDVCKCLEEPYQQASQAMQNISSAQASGDHSSLIAAQGEMMGVLSASGRCFDVLARKYPEIDKSTELQQKVMSLADKKCPNPAAAMRPK